MKATKKTDVLILGAGTAGLYALREVRRAKKSFLIVDKGPLGTTCARVGCMPSKAILQVANEWAAAKHFEHFGGSGVKQLSLDTAKVMQHVRQLRDMFAGGAKNNAIKAGGEQLLIGEARFIKPHLVEVTGEFGKEVIEAKSIVIATGSRPVKPGFLEKVADRMVTTDEFFELPSLPKRVGVLGLGAIGLELGLALARLGIEVVGVDQAQQVAGIKDPQVAAVAVERFQTEMPLWLGQAAEVERTEHGVLLKSGEQQIEVDLLLVALGRRTNLDQLNLEAIGVELDQRGMPEFNPETMQIGDLPIFITGDANADRPLMHEAADEGAIAGYNASRQAVSLFERKVPLAIAFTQPDIVTLGKRFDQLSVDSNSLVIGEAFGKSNGRARIMHGEHNIVRIYAEAQTGRLLGATMLGVGAEHLGHTVALAIKQEMSASELLAMPFYHPVLEEQLQTALQSIVKQLPAGSTAAQTLPFGLKLKK